MRTQERTDRYDETNRSLFAILRTHQLADEFKNVPSHEENYWMIHLKTCPHTKRTIG